MPRESHPRATHANSDAFEALFGVTYEVALPASGVALHCRRVPMITIMQLLSALVGGAQIEFANARAQVEEALSAFRAEADTSTVRTARIIDLLLPLLGGVAATLPGAMERVLLDVIVGATRDVVNALPAEDGLEIVRQAFDRMDKALLARQLDQLFFAMGETFNALATIRTARAPSASPESRTPSAESASSTGDANEEPL